MKGNAAMPPSSTLGPISPGKDADNYVVEVIVFCMYVSGKRSSIQFSHHAATHACINYIFSPKKNVEEQATGDIFRRRFSKRARALNPDLHAALRLFGRSLTALHHGMIFQSKIFLDLSRCFLLLCNKHHLNLL